MSKLHRLLFGIQTDTPIGHHIEKIVSGLGALIAIFVIASINALAAPGADAPLILASMGASAVLVFAMPHSPLTQPWPLLGGQTLSALVGVSCALAIADVRVAAALAVGLSLTAMYYLRCLHPPGGATALSAVVSGSAIADLGYHYVLAPVLVDTLVILAVAVLFNYCFPWRRYPRALAPQTDERLPRGPAGAVPPPYIGEQDLHYALTHMDSFVDVSTRDLAQIYRLAAEHADAAHLDTADIAVGRYYSNGRPGADWAVRKVVDESGVTTPGKDRIIYRVVAGSNLRATGVCERAEFARWAKYEVVAAAAGWIKKEEAG